MAQVGTYDRERMFLSGTAMETARLRLRPFEEGDAHAMWQMTSNANVLRYIPRDISPDETADKIEFVTDWRAGERFKFFFAVTWADVAAHVRDGVLGWVMMRPTEDGRFVEVGYWFREEFWGMGLATEAGQAAITAGMAELPVPAHDLFACVMKGNDTSRKVLTKLGLEYRRDGLYEGHEVWELYGPGAETYR